MERRTVEVRVAGQSYRVVSTAPGEELARLAGMVETKLGEVGGGRGRAQPQAILLAAMALAHELQEERARREVLERRTRDLLRRVLVRIDDAMEPFAEAEATGADR